jgi:Chemotaxis phosphatase CheX
MCSEKLLDPLLAAGGEEVVYSAIIAVAERSFFSVVDRVDEKRFVELAATHAHWLTATVNFEEPEWAGSVICRLPGSLAERMCDAFVGGEPDNRAPEYEHVIDMVGELANMICGAWLTRVANRQTFALGKPVVATGVGASVATEARAGLLFAIDDLPCSVEIQFVAVPAAAVAQA